MLKWVGSKRSSAQEIVEVIGRGGEPPFLWVPFGGMCNVARATRVEGWDCPVVVCDTNAALIGFHQSVQQNPKGLSAALQGLPFSAVSEPGWRSVYEDVRATYNQLKERCSSPADFQDPALTARFAFIVLTGFNGLYRENSKGGCNTPSGRYSRVFPPTLPLLKEVSAQLSAFRFHCSDFRDVMDCPARGDAVYLDPPYWPLKKSSFTSYSRFGFSLSDQRALAASARALRGRGVAVTASQADTPDARAEWLHGGWDHRTLQISRAVNSKATKRGKVPELLVWTAYG